MAYNRLGLIRSRLKDARSGKVVFVSHCILNENARYFGGAFRKAGVKEVLYDLSTRDIGIVQMVCPERRAWGGVQKQHIWKIFNTRQGMLYRYRKIILTIFKFYTIFRYRRMASDVIKEVVDYKDSGYEVLGLIGVDGSPSCGVDSKLELECAFEIIADLSIDKLERESFNNRLYAECLKEGSGMFFIELQKQAAKKKITPRFYSIDILREMKGLMQSVEI